MKESKVKVFRPVIFGLGKEVWVDDLVKVVTRPPLFLKVEFWADIVERVEA